MSIYCKDCGIKIYMDVNMVMLKDDIWLSIADKSDVLCDHCIQHRLGSEISTDMLKLDAYGQQIPCNCFWLHAKSKELLKW